MKEEILARLAMDVITKVTLPSLSQEVDKV
jgi:hypothetical protein